MQATDRIIVYTALFGDRDILRDPPVYCSDCEYLCFTDRPVDLKVWSVHVVPAPLENARRSARMYKLLPHQFLSDHKISLWVDANLTPATKPQDLVSTYLHQHDVVSFHHPARHCIYHEGAVCEEIQTDPSGTIPRQLDRYQTEGYPTDHGLAATGVLLRRNSDRMQRFCEMWWNEVSNYSVRDQISFNFAAWKAEVDWGVIPGRAHESPLFAYQPHAN